MKEEVGRGCFHLVDTAESASWPEGKKEPDRERVKEETKQNNGNGACMCVCVCLSVCLCNTGYIIPSPQQTPPHPDSHRGQYQTGPRSERNWREQEVRRNQSATQVT